MTILAENNYGAALRAQRLAARLDFSLQSQHDRTGGIHHRHAQSLRLLVRARRFAMRAQQHGSPRVRIQFGILDGLKSPTL